MFAIARSEMTQLVRNRLVAASSLFIPLAFSAVLIFNRENFGGTPVTAALILVTVTAMGTYITATTTLASRRQNLFLKRLRSTSAKDASRAGPSSAAVNARPKPPEPRTFGANTVNPAATRPCARSRWTWKRAPTW